MGLQRSILIGQKPTIENPICIELSMPDKKMKGPTGL
jgi:hypothetical protein